MGLIAGVFARRRPGQRGVAFVELAVVLPVLLVIILAALEYSLFVLQRHRLQVFARDVALDIYKRCEERALGALTQQCLQTESDPFYQQMSARFPSRHRVLLQVFRASTPYNAAAPCPLDTTYERLGSPLGLPAPSRVVTGPSTTVGSLCSGAGMASLAHNTIMSVEIMYRHDPTIVAMARLFGFENEVQYVTAVV